MIEATRQDIGRRIEHPNWNGRARGGALVAFPNRWHADVQFDGYPYPVRAAQGALEFTGPPINVDPDLASETYG